MNENDILKIVEESFDYHISAEPCKIFGPSISGKADFLKEVADKLKLLFSDNDLNK